MRFGVVFKYGYFYEVREKTQLCSQLVCPLLSDVRTLDREQTREQNIYLIVANYSVE